jgi:hypothetical protein
MGPNILDLNLLLSTIRHDAISKLSYLYTCLILQYLQIHLYPESRDGKLVGTGRVLEH